MQLWSTDHCRCGSKSDQQLGKLKNCAKLLQVFCQQFTSALQQHYQDLLLQRLLTRTMASGITVVNMARPTTKNMIWNILKLPVTKTINYKCVLQYLYGSWKLRPSNLGHRIDIAIAHCRHCHNHAIYTPECRKLVSRSVIILHSKNRKKIYFSQKIRNRVFYSK